MEKVIRDWSKALCTDMTNKGFVDPNTSEAINFCVKCKRRQCILFTNGKSKTMRLERAEALLKTTDEATIIKILNISSRTLQRYKTILRREKNENTR